MTMDTLKYEESNDFNCPKKKRRKPGIIYLSTIPHGMDIIGIRNYFSRFGQIDRFFLQPKSKFFSVISESI